MRMLPSNNFSQILRKRVLYEDGVFAKYLASIIEK